MKKQLALFTLFITISFVFLILNYPIMFFKQTVCQTRMHLSAWLKAIDILRRGNAVRYSARARNIVDALDYVRLEKS